MIVNRIIDLVPRIKLQKFLFSKAKTVYEHDLIYGVNPVEAALHANRR